MSEKNHYFSANLVLFSELRGDLRICLTPSGDLWVKLELGEHEERRTAFQTFQFKGRGGVNSQRNNLVEGTLLVENSELFKT